MICALCQGYVASGDPLHIECRPEYNARKRVFYDDNRLFGNPMDGYLDRIEERMEMEDLLYTEQTMTTKEQLAALSSQDIAMVENGDGVYWQAPGSVLVGTHRHGIARSRIQVYLDSGDEGGLPVTWCKYQNQLIETIPHAFILAAAQQLGIVRHACPKPETIVREVGLALTFGELQGLRDTMHTTQHLLNEDLRRAMVANAHDEIAQAQSRLADHMSLMAKVGVEPAPWDDNHHALMLAGRLEEETLDAEPTLWG